MFFFENHADAIITSVITIFGFIITIIISRNSIRNEIRKEKIANSNRVIQDLPFEICKLLNTATHNSKAFKVSDYSSIIDRVLSYGSKPAVLVVVFIQQLSFMKEKESDFGIKLMALFCLLITQLKYDLTDEIIPPDSWMRMRLTDFDSSKENMRATINLFVREIGLKKEFLISDC